MSNPRAIDRLEDMLRYSQEAVEIVQGKTRQDLDKIPREECLKYPEIPWHAIVSMRNRLIHAYGDVDLDIVWQVVKENLPALIEQLEVMISNLKRS